MGDISNLEKALFDMFVARVYPVLAANDPLYQRSLKNAGLGWNGDGDMAKHRKSFEEEMRMQAWLAATRIREAKSLEPDTVRAKPLFGPTLIYRVADSGSPKGQPGIWWFSEKVAQHCRDEAGPDPQKRLEWLRNVLAVCFNWSQFDRIERLALRAGEVIPSVIGIGLGMPHDKVEPYTDRKTGQKVVSLPDDYWKNKGKSLLGGELQTVLPWIPVLRVSVTPSL
jgi:hypothetical protein